jgi:hypothetical protein
MSGENSCFSRFLVKFVEVSAAGLATAISAYALAHLGGLLPSSTTPTSAPATAVQVSPTASEVAEGLRAKPTPPAAAAAVNKQGPAQQQDTDATVAQPARKAAKDAKALRAAQAHKNRYERGREGASRPDIGGSPGPGRTRQCRRQSAGTK